MTIGDVYILSLRALMNGQQVVNTMALKEKTAEEPTSARWRSVASSVKDWFRTSQVDDLSYVDWVAQKVRGAGVTYSTTAPFRVSTVSFSGGYDGTLTGAVVQPPAAQAACAVFAMLTDQAGRRRKGRFFLAGLSEGDLADDGTLDNTARANLVTAIANPLLASMGPGGTNPYNQLVVWSDRIAMNVALSNTWPRVRVSMGAPDPANADANVTSIVVRDYVGSQRDRRPGI